jgi:hypothetical protein
MVIISTWGFGSRVDVDPIPTLCPHKGFQRLLRSVEKHTVEFVVVLEEKDTVIACSRQGASHQRVAGRRANFGPPGVVAVVLACIGCSELLMRAR